MHLYFKNCNTFLKKLILISKNKIKGKSKCAIFLTGIENKCDLESELNIYLQFITDWCYKNTWTLIMWGVEKILKIQTQRFLKQKLVDWLCSQNVPTVELKSQDLWKNKKKKDYWVTKESKHH